MEITVRGMHPLWSALVQAYTEWQSAGQPSRDAYRLHSDQHGQQWMEMTTPTYTRQWPFSLPESEVL